MPYFLRFLRYNMIKLRKALEIYKLYWREWRMKLNIEQRKIGIKYNVMQLLSLDVKNKRYIELQQIYEALNLRSNNNLVNKLNEERNIGVFFTNMIYADVILVIADYIDNRPEILELVDLLYAKRCPHIKRTFNDWEKQYSSIGMIKNAKKSEITHTENCYLHFLFYKSEIFDEPDRILKGFDFEQDQYMLNYSFYVTDKNPFDNALIFCTDSQESNDSSSDNRDKKEYVFNSKLFEKYLKKRRNELAAYLEIEEEKISEFIHHEMKSQSKNGKASVRTGIVGQIELFTKDIIAEQNGGTSWYNAMTTTNNDKWYGQSILYVPNVDGLIKNYFKSYVTTRYIEEIQQNNRFTKLTLSRECIPANYEVVYQAILCMYEMDVLYKMFAIMQKQYYRDFSWEKITNQDIATRYENLISNLEHTIVDKENKINNLLQKNNMLSLQITADASKQTTPFVVENNRLIKIIENKDSEISDLKKRLEYQEQFIAELNKQENEEEKNTYDLEMLQSKKFLFVGHIGEALPQLKYKFPNSIFMESETDNLSGIEVDAVVMLIRWMSHSMFYKVKSTGALAQRKVIMCNTKNIDTILQKMYDEI